MRITRKGQVTIPAALRKKAGLLPGTEVEFSVDGAVVTLRPLRQDDWKDDPRRGERLVAHLRKFRGDIAMTTDEIMDLTRGE